MLLRILFLLLFSGWAWAQDGPGSNKSFVVIEVTAQRAGQAVSSKNPQERRWYVSNLVAPAQYTPGYTLKKMADEYFQTQVVDQLKLQGIELNYYDNNVQINDGAVYSMNTDQDVESCRQKAIQDHKEQSGNIFLYDWSLDPATPTQPKLFYRDKGQPLYEAKKKP